MKKQNERETTIQIIKKILKNYGIKKACLFGSFARGEKFNDIDVIIEPPRGFSLLDLSALANRLEEITGFKFDILTFKGISPYMKKYIKKEVLDI